MSSRLNLAGHSTKASWRGLLAGWARAGQSMSRKGNCYDNAVMKNFFGHLKEELFHYARFPNVTQWKRLRTGTFAGTTA